VTKRGGRGETRRGSRRGGQARRSRGSVLGMLRASRGEAAPHLHPMVLLRGEHAHGAVGAVRELDAVPGLLLGLPLGAEDADVCTRGQAPQRVTRREVASCRRYLVF